MSSRLVLPGARPAPRPVRAGVPKPRRPRGRALDVVPAAAAAAGEVEHPVAGLFPMPGEAESRPVARLLPPSESELAERLDEAHQAIERAVLATVARGREFGELLLEAKATIGHGRWAAWVEAH